MKIKILKESQEPTDADELSKVVAAVEKLLENGNWKQALEFIEVLEIPFGEVRGFKYLKNVIIPGGHYDTQGLLQPERYKSAPHASEWLEFAKWVAENTNGPGVEMQREIVPRRSLHRAEIRAKLSKEGRPLSHWIQRYETKSNNVGLDQRMLIGALWITLDYNDI